MFNKFAVGEMVYGKEYIEVGDDLYQGEIISGEFISSDSKKTALYVKKEDESVVRFVHNNGLFKKEQDAKNLKPFSNLNNRQTNYIYVFMFSIISILLCFPLAYLSIYLASSIIFLTFLFTFIYSIIHFELEDCY